MIYGWIAQRLVRAGWERLNNQELDKLPLADDVRFVYAGDHALAADLHSADEERAWLRGLFQRFPRLHFDLDDVVVCGPPWALRIAVRYRAMQDGEIVYQGMQFARMRGMRAVEERVMPDTQALARLAPRDSSPAG